MAWNGLMGMGASEKLIGSGKTADLWLLAARTTYGVIVREVGASPPKSGQYQSESKVKWNRSIDRLSALKDTLPVEVLCSLLPQFDMLGWPIACTRTAHLLSLQLVLTRSESSRRLAHDEPCQTVRTTFRTQHHLGTPKSDLALGLGY